MGEGGSDSLAPLLLPSPKLGRGAGGEGWLGRGAGGEGWRGRGAGGEGFDAVRPFHRKIYPTIVAVPSDYAKLNLEQHES